jgi:hypothetical protein
MAVVPAGEEYRAEFVSILATLTIEDGFVINGEDGKTAIEEALWNLFKTSPTARDILRNVPDLLVDEPFPILAADRFTAGFNDYGPLGKRYVQLTVKEGYEDEWFVDQNGMTVGFTLERSLIHEFIHATEGWDDPDGVNESLSAPGDVVGLTNTVMQEMGQTSVRLSYGGALFETGFPLGHHFTLGETIETARFVADGNVDMEGADSVAGTQDDLVFSTLDFANEILTGPGRDFVYAGGGNDTVDGGADNDVLFGENGGDVLDGGAGNDLLNGDNVALDLTGTSVGFDTLIGAEGDDTLESRDGLDTARYAGSHDEFSFDYDGTTGHVLVTDDRPTENGDEGTDRLFAIDTFEFGDGVTARATVLPGKSSVLYFANDADTGWDQKLVKVTTSGNGIVTTTHAEDGIKTLERKVDESNVKTWQEKTQVFDETGALVSTTKVLDNGYVRTDRIENNQIVEKTLRDAGNSADWDTRTLTFDADGNKVGLEIVGDDGTVSNIRFTSGAKAEKEVVDHTNTETWTKKVIVFDGAGDRTRTVFTEDDGDIRTIEYAGGEVIGISAIDNSDQYNWHIRARKFDYVEDPETGERVRQLSEEYARLDAGYTQTAHYWQGYLERIDYVDAESQFDWSTRRDSFEINGDIWSSYRELDDGDQEWIYYVEGVKDRRTVVDTNNGEDWHSRTEVYDALGDVTSVEYDNFIVIE